MSVTTSGTVTVPGRQIVCIFPATDSYSVFEFYVSPASGFNELLSIGIIQVCVRQPGTEDVLVELGRSVLPGCGVVFRHFPITAGLGNFLVGVLYADSAPFDYSITSS